MLDRQGRRWGSGRAEVAAGFSVSGEGAVLCQPIGHNGAVAG